MSRFEDFVICIELREVRRDVLDSGGREGGIWWGVGFGSGDGGGERGGFMLLFEGGIHWSLLEGLQQLQLRSYFGDNKNEREKK